MKKIEKWKRKELKRVCRRWQKKLGLRDWDIWVTYASPKDIGTGARAADVTTSINHRTAHIRLIDPKYIPEGKTMDVECTLIHELLHIPIEHFFDYKNISYSAEIVWEQFICHMAGLLRSYKHYHD